MPASWAVPTAERRLGSLLTTAFHFSVFPRSTHLAHPNSLWLPVATSSLALHAWPSSPRSPGSVCSLSTCDLLPLFVWFSAGAYLGSLAMHAAISDLLRRLALTRLRIKRAVSSRSSIHEMHT